jgi:putative acetyltransferase
MGAKAMNAGAFPKPTLRPYLVSDLPLLAEIRFAAIEELTLVDYDYAQRRAWASSADDDEEFAQSLEKGLTIVALIGGGPVCFIALQGGGLIDQLYVHPAVARTGVASALCDAIEKLAAARGTATLVTDASDTAKPLFETRGYQAMHRNTIEIDGEYLGNTRMTKTLAPKAAADGRP